jgi:hypothetical protein
MLVLPRFPAEFDDEALDRLFTLSGADVTECQRTREDPGGWTVRSGWVDMKSPGLWA